MKQLEPPFLEFNFYFNDYPDPDAFMHLVNVLVSLGAKFTGKGLVHRGKGVREKSFASIMDEQRDSIIINNIMDFQQYMENPNTRVVTIYLENATGLVQDKAEIVTYLDTSPEASNTDCHPLAIWTEGWLFSGDLGQRYTKRAKAAGRQAYNRFRTLVNTLRPAYAAITSEFALSNPADLRIEPRSLAFVDFYLNRAYLGQSKIDRIQELYSSAYIEPIGDGVYISCNPTFNPQHKGYDIEKAMWLSVEVAKIIATIK